MSKIVEALYELRNALKPEQNINLQLLYLGHAIHAEIARQIAEHEEGPMHDAQPEWDTRADLHKAMADMIAPPDPLGRLSKTAIAKQSLKQLAPYDGEGTT